MNINLKYDFSQSDFKQSNRQALNLEIVTSTGAIKSTGYRPLIAEGDITLNFHESRKKRKEKKASLALPLKNSPRRLIFDRRIFQSRRKPKSASYSRFSFSLSLFCFTLFSLFFSSSEAVTMGLIRPRNLRREIAKAGHKEAACNEYHEKEKIVSSRFCHVSGRNAKSGRTDRRMDWS